MHRRTGRQAGGRAANQTAGRTTNQSAYSPVRARQIARRRRQQRKRRRQMMAALAVVVLLAGGGAFGFRQASLQKHRQEYAEQGIAALDSQNYEQAVTDFNAAIDLNHGKIGSFESQMLL